MGLAQGSLRAQQLLSPPTLASSSVLGISGKFSLPQSFQGARRMGHRCVPVRRKVAKLSRVL